MNRQVIHYAACFLFCVLLPSALAGQSSPREIEVSLASGGGTYRVNPGEKLTFRIKHIVPGYEYVLDTSSGPVISDPLKFPKSGEESGEESGEREDAESEDTQEEDKCGPIFRKLAKNVLEATEESEVKTAEAQAEVDVIAEFGAGTEAAEECLGTINTWLARYTQKLVPGVHELGEDAVFTVKGKRKGKRNASGGGKGKKWRFEYTTTEQRRRFLVHYGFAFLPNSDDSYFAKPIQVEGDEDGAFQITEQGDQDDNDFEPVVTFTYLPDSLQPKPGIPKFTAGLGADLEETLVFAGLSWVVGDNVNIFLGAAGHKQKRLLGIYEPGQVVQATLTPDQLVGDTFDFNAIFGVGFRFNGNPFKKKAAATTTEGGGAQEEEDDKGKDDKGKDDKGKDDKGKDDKEDGDKEKDDKEEGNDGGEDVTPSNPGTSDPNG